MRSGRFLLVLLGIVSILWGLSMIIESYQVPSPWMWESPCTVDTTLEGCYTATLQKGGVYANAQGGLVDVPQGVRVESVMCVNPDVTSVGFQRDGKMTYADIPQAILPCAP